ncbi:MAG: hypothetical protein JSU96_04235 [Acidobacteriota bacterium]|nr:MAG: hypothetical protein JSU96_04235 [Acidobacteriota bacterium]
MGLISVLAALLIIGLLIGGYITYQPAPSSSKAAILTARDTAKDAACHMNRLTLEKALLTWSVQHPNEEPSIRALKRSGILVRGCPQNGELSIRNGQVLCSEHK